MKYDPRHLIQLANIVELQSFAAAAEHLNTTQPALSRTIAYLEERLGEKLFDRSRKPALPTPLALELAVIGKQIHSAVGHAEFASKTYLEGKKGRISVGAPPFMCDDLLGKLFADFLSINPGIDLVLTPGYAPDLRNWLLNDQLDIAIAPHELIEDSRLKRVAKLGTYTHKVLCRNDHPLLRKKRITHKDLEDARWISHQRSSLMHSLMKTVLHNYGVQRIQIAFESGSSSSLLGMIQHSDFLILWPTYNVEQWFLDKDVSFLPIDISKNGSEFHVLSHEYRMPNPTCERLIEYLLEVFY